jgi:hypothetical protein
MASGAGAGDQAGTPVVSVDWPSFLSRHDLVWEELPRQWNEGAFTGNGGVGMMVYATMGDNRLDFHMGRTDVTDHRKAPRHKTSMGVSSANVMYDFPRLDVGRMALRPAGRIQSGSLRQHLWDAEVRGTLRTELGELHFRCYAPRDCMVNVVEVESTEVDAAGKPAPWFWEFRAGKPDSPRAQVFPDRKESLEYRRNPDPVFVEANGVSVCVQSLLAGGDYASAWLERAEPGNSRKSTLYFSTANEVPKSGVSAQVAAATVRAAASQPAGEREHAHRSWWHDFYRKSFLSIPNARMESFYWIQLHKLACCSRPDGEAVDLFGPIFRVSQWPGLWWNLNVQLTYWPVYASNHLELGENFLSLVDSQIETQLALHGDKDRLGDYAWALHNYWLQLRYSGGWSDVHSRWLPKAELALNYYMGKLARGPDGRLHLAPMGSPEYKGFETFPDTNYNIAILRWLLSSMIECCRMNGVAARKVEVWTQTLADLVPFQVDENGLRIAANQPVDMSHRHFSHLLGLYPFFQLDPDSPVDRELVRKSVVHWHRIDGGKALAGYSFTGASSLYSSLGMGEEAHAVLDQFLQGSTGIGSLLPNTLYAETDGRNPTIETPLSAASAAIEMVLQSWGGKVRVFPAVPSAWKHATFHRLRTQGAFLVSAERRESHTVWVALESLAGEPCLLKVSDWSGPLAVDATGTVRVTERTSGEYVVDLRKGERVLLRPAGVESRAVVTPMSRSADERNPYGVKRGGNLPSDQSWPVPESGFVSPSRLVPHGEE